MKPADASNSSDQTLSIAARLQQRCGVDVDPAVDLAHASGERTVAEPSAGSGTGSGAPAVTLQRLETRPAAGRYEVRGEIARGGMGAILDVYDQDLRRRLAMKVILDRRSGEIAAGAADGAGTPDPVVLSRFLEEAQVTGQLDHPGIVPVHELGIDAAGRVYFTMRLVHGRDLEHIFDLATAGAEGWSVTRALSVLQKVCEAMAYAHDKGVVHRDLKPRNVMVGRFGEVYVMDWGLARVRDRADRHDVRPRDGGSVRAPDERSGLETDRREASGRADGRDLMTMDGDVVGTPSYMSPEQARGEIAAVDERADVYAVGAMLYRLLAGQAPYVGRGEQVGGAEVWRRVRAGPPVPIAAAAPGAPAELVAITGKAMAREPAQRYASMQALDADLRAFLEGRVVQAFETGAFAEARKWVRRNRALAAALAAALVALVLGLGASLVLADRARQSATLAAARRSEAEANAALAETRRQQADASAAAASRQARIAEDANAFLNDDLLAAVGPENDGKDVTVRQVLDEAATRLALRFTDEPEVEASLRLTIGTSYHRLGELAAARTQLERALALRREVFGDRAEPTLKALRGVASLDADCGQLTDALSHYEEALATARALLGPEHRGTLSTSNDYAIVLAKVGRTDEARALHEATLPIQERVLGARHADTVSTRNNLAMLDRAAGRYAAAERGMRRVLADRRATLGERHPDTLVAEANLALVLSDLGRLGESERLSREVLDRRREMLGPDHPAVGKALTNLALVLFQRGRQAEAEPLFRDALRVASLHGDAASVGVLDAQHNLAASIDDPARLDEVLALRTAVLAGRRRLLGPDHPDTLNSANSLAAALKDARRYDEAEALYRETLAAKRRVLGPEHPDTLLTLENLGGLAFAKGDYVASEAVTREVLEARRRALGDTHPAVARTMLNLARVLQERGDVGAAGELIEAAVDRSREACGPVHEQVAECLTTLGDLRFHAKDDDAALAAYGEALDVRRQLGPDDADCAYLLHRSGLLQARRGEHALALQLAQQAYALREHAFGKDAWSTLDSQFRCAKELIELKRFPEAETLALDFLERATRKGGAESEWVAAGRRQLVSLYAAWGKPEEAEKWH